MNAPVDELGDLRHALAEGDWHRFLDPNLEAMIRETPDLWPKIGYLGTCAMAYEITGLHPRCPELLVAWAQRMGVADAPWVAQAIEKVRHPRYHHQPGRVMAPVLEELPASRRLPALFDLVRGVLADRPCPQEEAVLAVLERSLEGITYEERAW